MCLSQEMKCDDGECINKLWKCDGEINCRDGSDEVDCGKIYDNNKINADVHVTRIHCGLKSFKKAN